MQPPIVTVEHLRKTYGRTEALGDISFSLAEGAGMLLAGPNGSGKTTLLRIIALLSRPTSGEIRICGLDPLVAGNEIRRRIGFVSHHSLLYPSLTALENLRFYARMFQIDHAEKTIEHFLNLVDLFARRHDLVRTFSRGMQQRLTLARALLHHPSLILFDEPSTGLDMAATAVLQRVLVTLKHEKKTMIVTTHEPGKNAAWSDEMIVLIQGKILYTGPVRSVRLNV